MTKIKGGFTCWARQTIESDIFFWKPAEWFKIWFFIVNKANHKNNKLFPRGSNYFCWTDDKTQLKGITQDQYFNCIKWLKWAEQIATQKTTRGNIITVLNYAKFQDLKNYKNKAEDGAKNEAGTEQKPHYKQEVKNVISNTTVPNGTDLKTTSMNPEELNDGEITYEVEGSKPKPTKPKGRQQKIGIIVHHCFTIQDKKSYITKTLSKIADDLLNEALTLTSHETEETALKEVLERIDVVKWHYDQIDINEFGLVKVFENWETIPKWAMDRKKKDLNS